jgi:hypothetical protein
MKYVYLYKITIHKEIEILYYIGMRVCKCNPYQDNYMGSPKKYKKFWDDDTYTKTKEILKIGNYNDDYDNFRDEEVTLIKEAWNQYGFFGENGKCLNAGAGKAIHPYLISGKNSPMRREEVKNKVLETRRRKYGPTTLSPLCLEKLKENSRKPETNAKRLATIKEKRKNPEYVESRKKKMSAAIGGNKSPNKRHERKIQSSELQKKRIVEGKFHLFDPELRKKAGESNRQKYLNNPELREIRSKEAKNRFETRPEIKQRMSEARKKWYRENPEKAKLKNKKSAVTRFKKQRSTLEDFFS